MTRSMHAQRPRAAASAASAAAAVADRVAGLDWAAMAADLDAHGCALTGPLLGPEECAALAAAYRSDELFRSRVIMARHGFGRGEYKYFAYPLPDTIAALRTALYPPLAEIANRWNEAMGIAVRYPREHAAFLDPLPQGRPRQAHAAAPAIWSGRLQLPAPGPLRRARLPAAGDRPAVGAGQGLRRRRIRAHRAAAAHAVARRGGAARARRSRDLPGPPPAGRRHARHLPGQHAPRREPAALRPPAHARHHLSRREVKRGACEMLHVRSD